MTTLNALEGKASHRQVADLALKRQPPLRSVPLERMIVAAIRLAIDLLSQLLLGRTRCPVLWRRTPPDLRTLALGTRVPPLAAVLAMDHVVDESVLTLILEERLLREDQVLEDVELLLRGNRHGVALTLPNETWSCRHLLQAVLLLVLWHALRLDLRQRQGRGATRM